MADALLKHEAELRRQGIQADERKKQLKTKYLDLKNSFSVTGTEVSASEAFEFPPGYEPSEADIQRLQEEAEAKFARRMDDMMQFMQNNFPTQLEETLGITSGVIRNP